MSVSAKNEKSGRNTTATAVWHVRASSSATLQTKGNSWQSSGFLDISRKAWAAWVGDRNMMKHVSMVLAMGHHKCHKAMFLKETRHDVLERNYCKRIKTLVAKHGLAEANHVKPTP